MACAADCAHLAFNLSYKTTNHRQPTARTKNSQKECGLPIATWDVRVALSPELAHLTSSLSSFGTGHGRNWSWAPNIHLHAALAATRPKTTQSSKELPPSRLLPWTPPAISPAA